MGDNSPELVSDLLTDLYIGGKAVPAGDGVQDPATGKVITSVSDGTVEDAIAAVDAAERAAESWAATAPRERAEILRKAFELMTGRGEDLARLISLENGKALADARGEVAYAAEFFRWYSEEAVRGIGAVTTAPFGGVKQSGIGREGGHEGMLDYLETQYVAVQW